MFDILEVIIWSMVLYWVVSVIKQKVTVHLIKKQLSNPTSKIENILFTLQEYNDAWNYFKIEEIKINANTSIENDGCICLSVENGIPSITKNDGNGNMIEVFPWENNNLYHIEVIGIDKPSFFLSISIMDFISTYLEKVKKTKPSNSMIHVVILPTTKN